MEKEGGGGIIFNGTTLVYNIFIHINCWNTKYFGYGSFDFLKNT